MNCIRATILFTALVLLASAGSASAFTLVPLEFTSAPLITVTAVPAPGSSAGNNASLAFNNLWASPYGSTTAVAQVVVLSAHEFPAKFGLGVRGGSDSGDLLVELPSVGGSGDGKLPQFETDNLVAEVIP